MATRIDPVATELYVDWLIANREQQPVDYKPPPAKEKWKMYLAASLLPMSGADKAVLSVLIDHANTRTGRCDPSQARIALTTNMPERTVRRSIDRLLAAGFLARLRRGRERGGRASNAYQVAWPKLAAVFESYKRAGQT